jgi:hypothetical protein
VNFLVAGSFKAMLHRNLRFPRGQRKLPQEASHRCRATSLFRQKALHLPGIKQFIPKMVFIFKKKGSILWNTV